MERPWVYFRVLREGHVQAGDDIVKVGAGPERISGLAGSHIHTELFASLPAINPGVVAADRPAPHAPARPGTGPMVTFARAGLTVAFDKERTSLLEMAETCDVPTRWACRTGVCHTCSTPLLSGAVTYSPIPLTEPDAGEVLLCCSRPDVDVVLDL